jgi:hypothetical protein
MDTLSKDLLQELECPVCMEYMLSPITMCEKGHNICSNCRSVLNKCPTCNQQFINARNVSLENLARDVQYPCIYRKSGCKKLIFQEQITEHQAECPYGSHKCPFAKLANDNCKWEGAVADIKSHIRAEHHRRVSVVTGKQSIVCTNYTYCRALFAVGEVFLYFSKVKDGIFYICVLYVGPKERASDFKYKIRITTTDRRETASMTLMTRSFTEDVQEIFGNGNCAFFHYNFVTNCTRVFKGLPIEIEIMSADR